MNKIKKFYSIQKEVNDTIKLYNKLNPENYINLFSRIKRLEFYSLQYIKLIDALLIDYDENNISSFRYKMNIFNFQVDGNKRPILIRNNYKYVWLDVITFNGLNEFLKNDYF